uniref:(2-5)A synthetase n=1 Tax=Lubomirskia baikalensis TaxID=289074 RepID=B2FUW6_9METZ|nr:(2-5)A synthetase [Lubomirskia baikalensis]
MAASAHSVVCTHDEAKRVVDELVKNIQENLKRVTGITPAEVIKGGSLGQGTAIPGDFDLDLVIYTDSISELDIRLSGYSMRRWTDLLDTFLQQTLGRKYQPQGKTDCAVQFIYNDKIGVDLLISPNWRSLREFYTFLLGTPAVDRMKFSVCTARWQAHFFQHYVNDEAKELIRRAKAWRNEIWDERPASGGKPKSYFLSLLVFYAYKMAKRQWPGVGFRDIAIRTADVLKQLVMSHETMDIVWDGVLDNVFYRRSEYPGLNCSRPRMMDPINPHNNLRMSGLGPVREGNYGPGDGKWSWIVANIGSLDLTTSLD